MTSKWAENKKVAHKVCKMCQWFNMSSVFFYWTDTWQHGIYLFYINKPKKRTRTCPQTLANIFICLLDLAWDTISRYQNGTPKVARKALNIGDVWNQVYCHGYKTVNPVLWSTFGRIVPQRIKHFWFKLAEISFFIIFDQNLVVFECIVSSIV